MSKIFNILLAVGFIALCIGIFFLENIVLPSPSGGAPYVYESPLSYLISTLPLTFGVALILYEVDRIKYKKIINIIISTGMIIFFVSLVIISPLLKLL